MISPERGRAAVPVLFCFPVFVLHVSVCAVGLGGFPHLRKENCHFLFKLSAQRTKGFVLLLQLWEFCSAQKASALTTFAIRQNAQTPLTSCVLHLVLSEQQCHSSLGSPVEVWSELEDLDIYFSLWFFFNYPWHVKVVLRAWVLCQSQPVGTPQHHSAAGDCLLPWQSSKVPGCGDCLRVWGDVCCPSFPHTSQLCKLQLERSKDLRHHFLIGAPKLPFSNALLSTFKLKQLLEQLMTVYFTQQLEFTEATHVFSHRYLFLKRSICSSF